MRILFTAIYAVAFCVACGASQPNTQTANDAPIDVEFNTLTGERLLLSANRGQPVLLCVFSSFDPTSQHLLNTLARFSEERTDILVLGVNIEPNSRELTPIVRDTLRIPFALLLDANNRLTEGTSALGPLLAVPSIYFVDAQGRLRARHVGTATRQELHEAANLLRN